MTDPKGILAKLKDRRSPMVSRKFEFPDNKPELSVSKSEVEEKLKQMKQKRLSRLNLHVEEQTKLSEIRKFNKSSEGEDIDEAIVTIREDRIANVTPKLDQQTETAAKSSPESRIPGSPKKSSSARRFITKFSCLNEELMSSSEELSNEVYGTPTRKSLPNRLDISKMHNIAASKSSANISEGESFVRNSVNRLSERSSRSSEFKSSNQNINDMISQELARNNMSNDEYSQRTVTYETFGKVTTPTTTPKIPKFSEANFLDVDTDENKYTKDNTEKGLEKPSAVKRKPLQSQIAPGYVLQSPVENAAGADEDMLNTKDKTTASKLYRCASTPIHSTQDAKIEDKTYAAASENISDEVTLDGGTAAYENINFETKSGGQILRKIPALDMKISKNPIPVPRKPTKEERVVKKFQEHFTTLRDVIKNESEVDFDEIEGFKHTLEEVNEVVCEYKASLDAVEVKFVPSEKLRRIRVQIDEIRHKVTGFKGLKRDMAYLELSNALSSNFFKVKNISVSSAECRKEKTTLLDDINSCVRVLEERVVKNEAILVKILEEQVQTIQANRIVPTLV